MKKIRFNASLLNSERLRKIQAEYQKKFAPSKISLASLADLAIEYGVDNAKKKLNLT
jgi:hypothetical protein